VDKNELDGLDGYDGNGMMGGRAKQLTHDQIEGGGGGPHAVGEWARESERGCMDGLALLN
jgi:hypothetical protein